MRFKELEKFFQKYEYEIIFFIIVFMTSSYSITKSFILEKIDFYGNKLSWLSFYSIYLFTSIVLYLVFSTKKELSAMRFRYKEERSLWNNVGIGLVFMLSLEHIWIIKYSEGSVKEYLSEFILLFLMLGFYVGYYIFDSKRNLFLEFLRVIKSRVDMELAEHSSRSTGLAIMVSSTLFMLYYLRMPSYFNTRPFLMVYWILIVMFLIIFFDALQVLILKQHLRKKYTN